MMQANRCQICGETYLGAEVPDRCPFCGAHRDHIKRASEWIDYGEIELSEQSKKDCEKALDLETNNKAFYACAASKAKDQITRAFFKRLSKQEGEHAELIAEMMGIEEPDDPDVDCSEDEAENMKEAHGRESRAIRFYQQVAGRAPEPRMQEVFRALTDIESEHLIVSSVYR
ncbi:MAG: ferritin family protein [Bacillota bacterium]